MEANEVLRRIEKAKKRRNVKNPLVIQSDYNEEIALFTIPSPELWNSFFRHSHYYTEFGIIVIRADNIRCSHITKCLKKRKFNNQCQGRELFRQFTHGEFLWNDEK